MLLWLRLLPAAAVLVALGAGWWYVQGLRGALEAAETRADLLHQAAQGAESARQALSTQLAAMEAAHEQRDQDYRRIAAAVRAGQAARDQARASDPAMRAWADTLHPAGVAAGLREAGDRPANGLRGPTGPGGAAGTD